MRLGVVRGTVTATVKHPHYDGRRLLVVALCDPAGNAAGKETVAVDTVEAGVGDRVLVLKEGNSARAVLGLDKPAVQEMIVAIVDYVEVRGA